MAASAARARAERGRGAVAASLATEGGTTWPRRTGWVLELHWVGGHLATSHAGAECGEWERVVVAAMMQTRIWRGERVVAAS